jgi:hypothetical protein
VIRIRPLAQSYVPHRELTPEEHPARRAEILMKVAHLGETANAVPGEWCYRRADRAMTQAKVEIKRADSRKWTENQDTENQGKPGKPGQTGMTQI